MKRLMNLLLLLLAGAAAAQLPSPAAPVPAQQSIELPPELDRVLRDYERLWRARDAAGLAALFAEDGFVLSSGRPPVRGRSAIREAYAKSGGSLFLRAFAYSTEGSTGYIIGGFRGQESHPDEGKFVLALRKDTDGRWLIAADMDNSNQRPRPPQPPQAPAAPDAPAPPEPPSPPGSLCTSWVGGAACAAERLRDDATQAMWDIAEERRRSRRPGAARSNGYPTCAEAPKDRPTAWTSIDNSSPFPQGGAWRTRA